MTGKPWKSISPEAQREIDAEALKRAGTDAALFFHHQALLEGKLQIHSRRPDDFCRWQCVEQLPQYREVEISVIEGWRTYVALTYGIVKNDQTDSYAVNCALILESLRRKRSSAQVCEILRRRAEAVCEAANRGDAEFFRRMGRILSERPKQSVKHEFARAMLAQWLTGFLWLMPEKMASDCLAGWLDIEDSLRKFRAAKHEGYNLKSHVPTLIHHISPDGKLLLTTEGRRLLP